MTLLSTKYVLVTIKFSVPLAAYFVLLSSLVALHCESIYRQLIGWHRGNDPLFMVCIAIVFIVEEAFASVAEIIGMSIALTYNIVVRLVCNLIDHIIRNNGIPIFEIMESYKL